MVNQVWMALIFLVFNAVFSQYPQLHRYVLYLQTLIRSYVSNL